MLVCDPECTDAGRMVDWEAKGFAIVSFATDTSIGKFTTLDVKCVTPDFFKNIPYDYKVKPSKFGEFNHIGKSDTPDLESDTWQTFEEVITTIDRESSDQQYKPKDEKDVVEDSEPADSDDEEEVTPAYLTSMRNAFEHLDD